MQHEAVGLIRDDARVTGVEARTPEGTVQIRAEPGCRLRRPPLHYRQAAELEVQRIRRSHRRTLVPHQPATAAIRTSSSGTSITAEFSILINRGDYFQAGLIIRKGSFEEMKLNGWTRSARYFCRSLPTWGTASKN